MSFPTIVPGQITKGDGASGASIAYPSDVTAGNFLLVYATQFAANPAGFTVSDSRGNTWTPAAFATTGGGTGHVSGAWFWAKAKDSGACTVSVITSGGNPGGGAIMEISGADGVTPVNQSASAALLAGSGSPASGNIATTLSNCLLIAGCIEGNNFETFSAGSGWTLQAAATQQNPANIAYAIETQTAATTGTFNGQFTMSIDNPWAAHVIAIAPVQASFASSIATIPQNHSGNISLPLVGNGANWTGGTTFSVTNSTTGTTTVTKVSQSFTDSEHVTLVVNTGSGTGTFTISDGTLTTTVTVAAAAISSISPNTGNVGDSYSCAVNSSNTLWTQETASTLFGVSGGGTGCAISNIVVVSDTQATFTLTVGQPPAGTLTITDNSTGATTSFTSTFFTIFGTVATPANGTGTISSIGKYIGGLQDYYIVVPSGNITVTISGGNAPSGTGATYRNGIAVNPSPQTVWEDGRIPGYNDALHAANPVTLTAGQSLVMAVSITTAFDPTDGANDPTGVGTPAGYSTVAGSGWTVAQTGGENSFLKFKCVLTVVAADPGTNSFRPPAYGTTKDQYHASDINRALLQSNSVLAGAISAANAKRIFYYPQLDFCESILAPEVAGLLSMNWSYAREYCAAYGDVWGALNMNLGWSASDFNTVLYGFVQALIDAQYAGRLDSTLFVNIGGFRSGRATWMYLVANLLGKMGSWSFTAARNGGEFTNYYRGKDRSPVQTLWTGWASSGNQYQANVLRNLNGLTSNEFEGEPPTGAAWTNQTNNGSPIAADKNWGYAQQNSHAEACLGVFLQEAGLEGAFAWPAFMQNCDRQVNWTGAASEVAAMAAAACTGNWDNLDYTNLGGTPMPLASATTAGSSTALTLSTTVTTTCNGAVSAGATSFAVVAGANLPAPPTGVPHFTIGGDGTHPSETFAGSVSGNTVTPAAPLQFAHNTGSVVYPVSLVASQVIGIAQDGTNHGEPVTISSVGSTIVVASTVNNHAIGANVFNQSWMNTGTYGPQYGSAATGFQLAYYNARRASVGTQNWNAVGGSGGGLGMMEALILGII